MPLIFFLAMHWCYLADFDPATALPDSNYEIRGEEAHHALKVMRLRVGDACEIFNGRGAVARARVTATEGSKTLYLTLDELYEQLPALPEITLALSIPKGGNMELIVQKAVELGVSRIIPLQSDRCIVRLKDKERAVKQEKWQRTALEACKQCKACQLPLVEPVQSLESFLQRGDLPTARLCCALVAQSRPLRAILEPLREQGVRSLIMLVGPEGDFTPQEYAAIDEAGFAPASLGALILRVETAVFMAMAAARYALDD